jgi:tripartite-type tricarboxylate transporter receptor subunit TctC
MMKSFISNARTALVLCSLLCPIAVSAQGAYPNRSITIIVPFPPGGGTDVGARLVAKKLQEKWGHGVVIDNKGGAAGIVGSDAVAKAKPDGYTLLVGNVGTVAINQSLYKKMPYDADTAFQPISMIADLPLALLVNPNVPYNSVKELIDYAKANPEKITFASSGAGGAPHLAAEIFSNMANVKLTHVPYKGGGPATADLIAGHVNILFATILEAAGQVKSGRLKALAVTSKIRSAAFPDVPTIAESGLPGYESGSWIGMLAPTGTPKDIVEKISADVQEALANAEVKQTLVLQGAIPRPTTSAQFTAIIDVDKKRYAKIIADRGIKLD